MNINITEVIPKTSERYPYSHRVQVSGDAQAADKVSAWLDQTSIPYVYTMWGVYYLSPEHTNLLLLRWS